MVCGSKLVKAAQAGRVPTKSQVHKEFPTNEELKDFLEHLGHKGLSGKRKEELLSDVVAHFRGVASRHSDIVVYVQPQRERNRAARGVHETLEHSRTEVHDEYSGRHYVDERLVVRRR